MPLFFCPPPLRNLGGSSPFLTVPDSPIPREQFAFRKCYLEFKRDQTGTSQDLAAPDILVIGRRTHDVDIRRRENDIQPYQVVTGEEVSRAHRDDLDGYFRSRVTSNTIVSPPSLGQTGDTNSQIDLRGLGSAQTLILIDGQRMPGIPVARSIDFGQPDLNGVPLHAILRGVPNVGFRELWSRPRTTPIKACSGRSH